MKNISWRWLLQAGFGLLLTGAGLSMAIDAGFVRYEGGNWFWYGTAALVIFNAGLSLLVDAPNHRME